MRRFLSKVVLSAGLTVLVAVGIWSVVVGRRQALCRLNPGIHILVAGNSTVEYGLNDSIMPGVRNIGVNADQIEYIYAKLKLLCEQNPGIDTLLLEFDSVILYKHLDGSHRSEVMHPFYFDCFDGDDLIAFATGASFAWNTSYLSLPFSPEKLVAPLSAYVAEKTFDDLGIGGYRQLDRHKLAEDIARQKAESEALQTAGCQRADYRPKALIDHFYRKIISYCAERGITVIFFTLPVHPQGRGPANYRKAYCRYFNDVPLYDFSEVEIPDSGFADMVHLNTDGARMFSPVFDRVVRSGHQRSGLHVYR